MFNESFEGTYRDSTAVSDAESKFFVLQRESIVKMQQVFHNEFNEIKQLAKLRKARHKKLIDDLISNCQIVCKQKKCTFDDLAFGL